MEQMMQMVIPNIYHALMVIGPIFVLLSVTYGMLQGTKRQNWQPMAVCLLVGSVSVLLSYFLKQKETIHIELSDIWQQIVVGYVVAFIFLLIGFLAKKEK